MKILIIGSGGREHALAWKIKKDDPETEIFAWPGNAGMNGLTKCLPFSIEKIYFMSTFADENNIDLTIVGPEALLAGGIVDLFQKRGLPVFGPNRRAAKIEASKIFGKQLMTNAGIPTAGYWEFSRREESFGALENNCNYPMVVKADGLMAGKGVMVCHNYDEAHAFISILEGKFLIERYLQGQELSFIAFTDGETILPLLPSRDHKPLYEGGPNTGGMGAYAPAEVSQELYQKIMDRIMYPAIGGLKRYNIDYQGILYAGLMIQNGEPYVLEFNCHFGDPETQPLMMLLKTNLVEIMQATIEKRLREIKLEWRTGFATCVVLASEAYPRTREAGRVISGLEKVTEAEVFHAGTALINTDLVTNGGRILNICSYGKSKQASIDRAYAAVKKVYFKGMYFREDIGRR